MSINNKIILTLLSFFFLFGTSKAQMETPELIDVEVEFMDDDYLMGKDNTKPTDLFKDTITETIQSNLPDSIIWAETTQDSLGGTIMKNQFIAKFESNVTEAQKIEIRAKNNATLVEKTGCAASTTELELWYLDFDQIKGISNEEKKASVSTTPKIEGLDFNYITIPSPITEIVDVESQSNAGRSGIFTKVAIIDTGIDENHPMVKAFIDHQSGYDFVNFDENPSDQSSRHGTHVASTTLHYSDYTAKIINLKVFESSSNKNSLFYITAATYHATCMGAKVINMSLGWLGSPANCLKEAIEFAGRQNCALVICSAGNDSLNLNNSSHYPSGYNLDNIISVAALDSSGGYASYSSYGSNVDIALKGIFFGAMPNSTMGAMQGTSVSAAKLSGIVAGLYANNPRVGYLDVKNYVLSKRSAIPNCNKNQPDNIGFSIEMKDLIDFVENPIITNLDCDSKAKALKNEINASLMKK